MNVSARQLADAGFVPTVSGALAASGIEASRLVLEITEPELVTGIGPAAASQVAGDDGVYLCSPSWTASETSAIGS